VQGINPHRKFSNKLHCILGVKNEGSSEGGRFNESNSQKGLKKSESKKSTLKKKK